MYMIITTTGTHPGSYPSPLHEGSEVTDGEKFLIRTDIVYQAENDSGAGKRRRKTNQSPGPGKLPEQHDTYRGGRRGNHGFQRISKPPLARSHSIQPAHHISTIASALDTEREEEAIRNLSNLFSPSNVDDTW